MNSIVSELGNAGIVKAEVGEVGRRVALVGAGGIGFDVAEFLGHDAAHPSPSLSPEAFATEWGIDRDYAARGGLEPGGAKPTPAAREIWLLQRKKTKPGAKLE